MSCYNVYYTDMTEFEPKVGGLAMRENNLSTPASYDARIDQSLKSRMILPDLIDGLVCALAEQGETELSLRDRRFYSALQSLQPVIDDEAKKAGFRVSFFILLDPVHGTSRDIDRAIQMATQTDVVSLDNPTFAVARFKVDKHSAVAGYRNLPGNPDFYRMLAAKFLEALRKTT